jgi:hypothetical protein
MARIPKAVSAHMAKLARKAAKAVKGTPAAKERARKASVARWAAKKRTP